jgi:murein DD-endopeptidase MepM/ murein hydrolase activator NlpD
VPGDERAAVAEEPFDPGVETGYLRRGAQDRELPVEAGAEPFDPGPGIGYDRKRAKRSAKERQRNRREDRKAEVVALSVAEQELVEERREDADERDRLVRERQAELERERLERERSERRARVEREREEWDRRARMELEERERAIEERRLQAERRNDERRRAELERRARIEAEREDAATAERERRRRERTKHSERWERDQAATRGKRRKREEREERERKRKQDAETKRAAARRRRAKRQMALGRGTPPHGRPATGTRVRTVRAGAKRRHAPRRGQLAAPTAKAVLALAAVTAAGTFLGAAVGLPVPVVTSDDDLGAQLAGAGIINESGTPVSLSKGPYFPVVLDAPADYGEGAAKFHASRGGRKHEGLDVFAKPGTPLVAVRSGIVVDGGGGKSFYAGGGGNSLVIYSPLDQRSYVYLHMLRPPTVPTGETVEAGQVVGAVGCTGSCDGPHLHFEVRNGRVAYGAKTKAVDPLPLLEEWPQAPGE